MTREEELKKIMFDSIVKSKDLNYGENPFYWYAQLDYRKETSHPEWSVLREKVKADLKIIEEANRLMRQYEKIGVNEIREEFTRTF